MSVDLDVSREACVHLTSGILELGTQIAFFKTVSNFPVVYCKVKTFKPKPFIHDGKKSTWISNKVRNSMIKRLKVHNIYISKTFERLLALPILNPNFLVQL